MGFVKLKTAFISISDRSNLILTFKIIALIAATLAVFSEDLAIIFSDALQSEITSHILAVPFVFAYMLYRKRKTLRAVLPLENAEQSKRSRYLTQIIGVLLFITAILLYWYGSYSFTPLEYHLLALPIFVSGLILLIFTPQALRHLAFPVIFLFFLIPPPSELLFAAGSFLSTLSAQVSSGIASLIGVSSTFISEYSNPVIQIARPDGALITFTVDIACSGIYSLIGFFMFGTIIAYIIRDKLWKRIALLLTGIPIMYFFNILRITSLLVIGYHYGENLGLQVFHSLGGWISIFVGTFLLLFTSEKIFKMKIFAETDKCEHCVTAQRTQDFCHKCGRILKAPYAKIRKIDIIKIAAVAITVTALVVIQAPVFTLAQSPAIVLTTPAGQQVSTEILPTIPGYTLQFDYRDTDFENRAEVDMALAYIYVPQNHSQKNIWVAVEIASARSLLHRWETCLVDYPLQQGWALRVAQIELRDIQLYENPPIIGRYFAFQYIKTDQLQTVLYWYESASFNVNSTLTQKHVKISLVAYPSTIEEASEIQEQQFAIAEQITEYWQPIKIWSPVALMLSQNGIQLAALNSILILGTLILFGVEREKQRRLNKSAYKKLSEIHKQIIDSVEETEKTNISTLENITSSYREATGQAIDKQHMLQKLAELEKIGLVRSVIISKQDEPFKIWKADIQQSISIASVRKIIARRINHK
jgi:exosortase